MSGKRSSARKIKATERRIEVLELRKRGLAFREIAEAIGTTVATAHRDYVKSLRELNERNLETAEDLRTLAMERINTYRRLALALVGDRSASHADRLKALTLLLKLQQEENKLYGIYMPELQQIELQGVVTFDDAVRILQDAGQSSE